VYDGLCCVLSRTTLMVAGGCSERLRGIPEGFSEETQVIVRET
jgi:hypothetical protein